MTGPLPHCQGKVWAGRKHVQIRTILKPSGHLERFASFNKLGDQLPGSTDKDRCSNMS